MCNLGKTFSKLFILTLVFLVSCNVNPTINDTSLKTPLEKNKIKITTGKNNLSFKTKASTQRIENDNSKIILNGNWQNTVNANASGGNYSVLGSSSPATIDDSNSSLTYYGTWQQENNTNAYGGSYKSTNPNNSLATLIEYNSTSADLKYSDSWQDSYERKYTDSTPIVIDDKNTSLTYSGTGWSQNSESHISKTTGNYIEMPFSGTNIEIFGSKSKTAGQIDITITNSDTGIVEKTLTSVDLYSSELIKSTSLVKIKGLKSANYIAKIEVLIEGYTFDFDKAMIYPSMQYKFSGTSNIYYYALKEIKGGKAYVILDDRTPELIDLYSPVNSFEVVKEFLDLKSSEHLITIEGTSETNVNSIGNIINFQKFASTSPYLTGTFGQNNFTIRYFQNSNYGKASLYVFDDDGTSSGTYTEVKSATINGVTKTFPYEVDMYSSTSDFNTVTVSGLSSNNHLFALIPKIEKNANSTDYFISLDSVDFGVPQLSYTISAKDIHIIGRSAPDQGKMIIRINGENSTVVDLYNPTEVWQSNLFEMLDLDGTSKTITIEPAYSKNVNSTGYDINFDAFVFNLIPKLYIMIPNYGEIGDSVILGGVNFSTIASENIVKFGNIQATVTEASDDYLKVTVPTDAVTGKITVETPIGTATSEIDFNIAKSVTLDTNTNISRTNNYSSYNAKVTVDINGIIHSAWEDKKTDNPTAFDIFYTNWDTTSWSDNIINVTNSAGANISSKNPSIATDNAGNKHIVFSLGNTVFYTYSLPDSDEWAFPPIPIATSSTNDSKPQISIGTSKIHVIWESDSEIYYSQSASGGLDTWSDPTNISISLLNSTNASLATDGRDIAYVTWQDNTNDNILFHIYYSRLSKADDVDSWTDRYDITGTTLSIPATNPTIALDNASKPVVAWVQSVGGFNKIFYSKNTNRESSTSWTSPLNITNTTTDIYSNPKIIADSFGYSYVVWQDNLKNIYLSKQNDVTNNTWDAPVIINNDNSSRNPAIAMDYIRNTMHIVWESNKDDLTYDIYHVQKACNAPSSVTNRTAEIYTNKGVIKMLLFEDKMPITTANFIDLVNSNFYDGISFHRYEAGFVIQGGDPTGTGSGGSANTIPLETNKSIKFDSIGVVGMARGSEPDTARSQFFILLDDAMSLNGGYAAFAKVYSGFDVLLSLRKDDVINDIIITTP